MIRSAGRLPQSADGMIRFSGGMIWLVPLAAQDASRARQDGKRAARQDSVGQDCEEGFICLFSTEV
jgi:hypothetical protein